ncbi:hypothetical protein BV898_18342 [Hypsibius exemplaris]|uniref:Uncharacterized protein n=1 Tax=Hypsibius exemplaris TaxID=2072580 RepID=A0A9X6NHE0_HYPEX|nr:hypothetical protein BV898_18342 [Hypsibius exemplaris]
MAISSISLILLSCSVGITLAQFSGGFPFNLVPGGLRIPFIGGGQQALGGLGTAGTLGSGLGATMAGQGGWGGAAQAPVQQLALPVQQTSNNGWGSQPAVQQSLAAPIQQQLIPQPIVQQLAAPVQQSGWGSQPAAAPVVIPQAQAPTVQAPVATNSGWGSGAKSGYGVV